MQKNEQPAEIVQEYGPFPGVSHVHGVSFDGRHVWYAAGETLRSFDPATGEGVRSLDVACDAGTAFDGRQATLAPGVVAGKLWDLYRARADVTVEIA